jgi:anti-anti-sigma regulatory factor
VLKITEVSRSDSAITLKLEGKVLAPWVDELRRICTEPPHEPKQIHLDLDAVTFLDEAGIELMRELIRQGITIVKCSGFIAEVLHVDRK